MRSKGKGLSSDKFMYHPYMYIDWIENSNIKDGASLYTSRTHIYIYKYIYIVYIEAGIYTECNLSKTYKKKQRKTKTHKKKIPQKQNKCNFFS